MTQNNYAVEVLVRELEEAREVLTVVQKRVVDLNKALTALGSTDQAAKPSAKEVAEQIVQEDSELLAKLDGTLVGGTPDRWEANGVPVYPSNPDYAPTAEPPSAVVAEYDNGGDVPETLAEVTNTSSEPERVVTAQQNAGPAPWEVQADEAEQEAPKKPKRRSNEDIAAENGVELSDVKEWKGGGRITKADIEEFAKLHLIALNGTEPDEPAAEEPEETPESEFTEVGDEATEEPEEEASSGSDDFEPPF